MALSAQQLQEILVEHSTVVSRRRETWPLTSDETVAYWAAIDAFIEANATAFNAALPLAARTKLTAGQKAEGFAIGALKRYGG